MAEDALDRLKNRTRSSVPPRDASLVDPKTVDLGQPLPNLPTKEQVFTPTAADQAIQEINSAGLMRFCSEANITKEVFSEAAYRVCMQNPKFMHEVMQVAHRRHDAQQHTALVERQHRIQPQGTESEGEDLSLWLL